MATTKEVPPRRDAPEPPAGTPTAPAHASYPPRRAALVGVILGTVVATALTMATFIWYRWHAVVEPTTAVIVEGSPAFDGTVVTVAGARLFKVKLSATNNYVATVLVEPGHYRVRAEREGRLLQDVDVEVERFLGVRIRLADAAPDPDAASAGATRPSPPYTP